jgi:hypothetical protein
MRHWKPTINSLFGFLGASKPAEPGRSDVCGEVQRAMLCALGDSGAVHFPKLVRRILQGRDVAAFWYLRENLMYSLSLLHGEAMASEIVEEISEQMEGFGFTSRPSPLGRF